MDTWKCAYPENNENFMLHVFCQQAFKNYICFLAFSLYIKCLHVLKIHVELCVKISHMYLFFWNDLHVNRQCEINSVITSSYRFINFDFIVH